MKNVDDMTLEELYSYANELNDRRALIIEAINCNCRIGFDGKKELAENDIAMKALKLRIMNAEKERYSK